jgi:precorrin-6Y C5,15-methyltransferase (decarboxylating)
MPVFDRYLMVDWSAANGLARGKDSVWACLTQRGGDGIKILWNENFATRHDLMQRLKAVIAEAAAAGEKLLVGFDFSFGYPMGTGQKLSGQSHWRATWRKIAAVIEDGADNSSNRFEAAARLNVEHFAEAPMFWGHPQGRDYVGLSATKPAPLAASLPELRMAERRAKGAQSVWKLTYPGSVGSQTLLGIAQLSKFLDAQPDQEQIKVWPFETGFAQNLSAPCIFAEIFPSLFPVVMADGRVRDELQVEMLAVQFAEFDRDDALETLLAQPQDLTEPELEAVLCEEGWILGLGVDARGSVLSPLATTVSAPAAIGINADGDVVDVPAAAGGGFLRRGPTLETAAAGLPTADAGSGTGTTDVFAPMSKPWLTIVGIGDNGLASLGAEAHAALAAAETIVLGERLETVLEELQSTRLKRTLSWASGFRAVLERVKDMRGTPVTILATGDPLHFGIGATLAQVFASSEMRVLPSPSAFSLAASRLGWPLQAVAQISLHGRPVAALNRHLLPGARILALTSDASTVLQAADILVARGFGASVLHVLAHMGGPSENILRMTAGELQAQKPEIGDFHTLAIDCAQDGPLLSPVPGLPDDAFVHDGQLTKREIRAATLSLLAPFPNALLWDVGAGCGSIAIEWLRSGLGTRAVAIESKPERLTMIRQNADTLGVPDLTIIEGAAPDALAGLDTPDVIFIGGGITQDNLFQACWTALKPGGRLVANVVTLEGEARLVALREKFGGALTRISVARAAPVGRYCGWKTLMPVTLWSVAKGRDT